LARKDEKTISLLYEKKVDFGSYVFDFSSKQYASEYYLKIDPDNDRPSYACYS